MNRRTIVQTLLLVATVAMGSSGLAQSSYPDRPIRLIVPFAAGGNTDVLARMYGQKLSEILKTPVVIENKVGSGSVIGTDVVAKSPADGYTLLFGTSSHTVNATLYPKLPYDSRKDLVAVSLVAEVPMVLSVNPSVPAKTADEFVSLLRSSPGKYSFASSGSGGSLHMAVELLKYQEKVSALHIPYRGAGPALIGVIAGQTDFIIDPITTSAPFVKSGKLRALAVTTAKRAPVLPDVPTMQELGFSKYTMSTWNLVMAPAGTPAAVIAKLDESLQIIYKDADFNRRLADIGVVPLYMTPAHTTSYIEREAAQWGSVIRNGNLRPD